MRTQYDDGFGQLVNMYDEDSVFNTVTVAAAGGLEYSTDPIFINSHAGASLVLAWTAGPAQSTDFDIDMRIFYHPRDVIVLATLNIRPNVSAALENGIVVPIQEIANAACIYGWIDIQIENNDPVNDLIAINGKIYQNV